MAFLSLNDLFARDLRPPHDLPRPAQRILDYLDISAIRLSELNKTFYEAINGHPFVHLKGSRDSYAIFTGFRKRHIEEIREKTGWQLSWPTGTGYLKLGQQLEGPKRPFYRTKGSTGTFRIGYAFGTQQYVGIKITKSDASEYEFQKPLDQVPHILYARDCCVGVGAKGELLLFQIMDLAGLGSVDGLRSSILKLEDPQFKEHLRFFLAKGLLLGLHYMHALGLYHLDVKPENFVVTHKGEVRLIDFGCSRQGDKGQVNCSAPDSDGDERYFSPERWLASYGIGSCCDGAKIDAWAAGISLLELFKAENDVFCRKQVADLATRSGTTEGRKALLRHFDERLREIPELSSPHPNSVWSAIRGLLKVDPEQRLTVGQAVQYPWFALVSTPFLSQSERTINYLTELIQSRPLHKSTSPIKLMLREDALSPLISPQNIPLPHFTNYIRRDRLERCIKERLLSDKHLTVCHGMGGVGKSQLALYITHSEEIRKRFGLRLWFRSAEQKASLDNQVFVLASELRLISQTATSEEALKAYRQYLSDLTMPFLVVFDNADDLKLLDPYLLKGKGQFLLTSRNGQWPDKVSIDVFTEEESIALIKTLIGWGDENIPHLAKRLGYLPLGMVQACAYVRNNNLKISNYLSLLQQQESVVLLKSSPLFGRDLPTSMGALWETTLEALRSSSPDSIDLLASLAFLAPDLIPASLVLRLANRKRSVIDKLLQYALLTNQGETYSMHRTSQAICRWKYSPTGSFSYLGKVTEAFQEQFEPTWPYKGRIRLLFAHGVCLNEHITKAVVPKDELTNRLLQKYYAKMGKGCVNLFEYNFGILYYKKCLDISKNLIDVAEQGRAYHGLGECDVNLGKWQTASDYVEKSLKIAQKFKNRTEEANAYLSLGALHVRQGRYSKGISYAEKSLQIAIEVENFLLQGEAYSAIGFSYVGLNEYLRAIGYHENSLRIALKLEDLGLEARSCVNLGLACIKLRDHQKGINYLDRGLQIALALEDISIKAVAYGNLGLAYHHLGQCQKALGYYETNLQIAIQLKDPLEVGKAYNNLGACYLDLLEDLKSVEYFEKAHAAFSHALGLSHPHTLQAKQTVTRVRQLISLPKN